MLYPEAAAELAAMGYTSTLEYVAAAAAAVLCETGLLPHINAGEQMGGPGGQGGHALKLQGNPCSGLKHQDALKLLRARVACGNVAAKQRGVAREE